MTANFSMARLLAVTLLLLLYPIKMMAQYDEEDTDTQYTYPQASIKYCDSYEDMTENNWHTADSVWVITKSRNKQMTWGGCDYKFDTDDTPLKNTLKKEVFAIIYNDTLLLNAYKLKDRKAKLGNGYVRAYQMTDGNILITYMNKRKVASLIKVGTLFGNSVAFTAARNTAKRDVCYIVQPGHKDIILVDKLTMPALLKDFPILLKEYDSVDKELKQDADITLPLLRKAKLIKEEEK